MRSCRMFSFNSSSLIIQRDQEENGQSFFSAGFHVQRPFAQFRAYGP